MKVEPEIPKCKQCGAPLYQSRQLFYDKRKKYCPECAEQRKRGKDADRMKKKREERQAERTERIETLEAEVAGLRARVSLLSEENAALRRKIIALRQL